jgi:hypothetical protein
MKLNDPAQNEAVLNAMIRMRAKAAQQPISYAGLFAEAMNLLDEQYMRAMAAEAKLHKIREIIG